MERPALARLLAGVAAGMVDAVIVYKVDLTRSLARRQAQSDGTEGAGVATSRLSA